MNPGLSRWQQSYQLCANQCYLADSARKHVDQIKLVFRLLTNLIATKLKLLEHLFRSEMLQRKQSAVWVYDNWHGVVKIRMSQGLP